MNYPKGYFVSSRDYLQRAKMRLAEGTPENLFYAAFELRCGVEVRMQEYLNAQDQISKSLKKGWQIAKLGRNIEQVFKVGDKVVQIIMRRANDKELIQVIYYTPVIKELRDKAESINSYMHSQKKYHHLDSSWWADFRQLLEEVYRLLKIANTGTLLGPPMWNLKTGILKMIQELPGGEESVSEPIRRVMYKGSRITYEVKYLDSIPNT
jgi:hypothetical protein